MLQMSIDRGMDSGKGSGNREERKRKIRAARGLSDINSRKGRKTVPSLY